MTTRIVYSSGPDGDGSPKENKPASQSLPAKQQTAYLRRETKGRGGKTVTVITNLTLSETDRKAMATALKKVCGTGGAVKDADIEIQGDHREKIGEYLKGLGYKVKFAGG
ncbi:MAG TPA: translation initiation factor [Anaerolineales bacterium]|nr:translation initiation factor [Anaerolineales bacterium]